MNTDKIATEAALSALGRQNPRFNLYRGQDPSFRQADVDFWTSEFKAAIEKAIKEHDKEQHYYAALGEAESRAAHASDDLDVELDALEYHVKNKQTTFALTTIKSLRRLLCSKMFGNECEGMCGV